MLPHMASHSLQKKKQTNPQKSPLLRKMTMIPIFTYFTYSMSYHFIPFQLINARNYQGVPWLWLVWQSANLWRSPWLMPILGWQESQKLLPTNQRQVKLSWWVTSPCILRIRPDVGQRMDMGKAKHRSKWIHCHPAVYMQTCQPLDDDLGQGWKDSRPISTLLGGCSPQTQKCLFSHYFRISRGREELLVAGFQRLSILPCIWLLPCDKPIVLMRLQVCPFLKVAGRMVVWCWAKEKG